MDEGLRIKLAWVLFAFSLLILLGAILSGTYQIAVVGVVNGIVALLLIRRTDGLSELSHSGRIGVVLAPVVLVGLVVVDLIVGSGQLRLIMFSAFVIALLVSIVLGAWRTST